MATSLERVCEVVIRLCGSLLLVRAFVAIPQGVYFYSADRADEFVRYGRDMTVIGVATSLGAGLLLLCFSGALGRLIGRDHTFRTDLPNSELMLIATRLVALIFVITGFTFAASSAASWWLDLTSNRLDAVWYEPARIRAVFLRSVISIIVGMALFASAGRIARRWSRDRAA